MRRYLSLLTFVLASILMAACTQEVSVPPKQNDPPAPPVANPPQPQPTPSFAYTAPLTGLGTNEPPERRPVAVMVNNHAKARPQSGLDKADLVYEILAEGEITRFVAVYQSQWPQVIGPVRSIRPYYIQIGAGLDAVMVHVGGSPDALATLARSDYNSINEISAGSYFWREKFRQRPHNVYTSPDRIHKAMEDRGMRLTSTVPTFPFLPAGAKITDGQPATKIDVTFHPLYKVSYQYDEQSGKYLRFTQGKPHMDLTTNKQLSVTNLLVLSARHRVLDSEGRREVDVVGPGDGYLFRQGKAVKIKWKRSGGVIRAYEDDALTKEVPLLRGNTWVNIIPASPGLGAWLKFQ